ncbi:MAG: metallophosphoesterase, partial [Clostridia bacterium]|nr:metallophosphoesterase [Clostridia bacterium]
MKRILAAVLALMLVIGVIILVRPVKVEAAGITFNTTERYQATDNLSATPLTIEAVFTQSTVSRGAIFGNYINGTTPGIVLEIYTSGEPRLFWQTTSTDAIDLKFDQVNVCTGEEIRLTITRDLANKTAYCYVNGVLKQTKTWEKDTVETQVNPIGIGADRRTNNNSLYFKGTLYSVSLYSDLRTADEVKTAATASDENALCYYDFSTTGNERLKDISGNGAHLMVVNSTTYACEEAYSANGIAFGSTNRYETSKNLPTVPQTLSATFTLSSTYAKTSRAGAIIGDYLNHSTSGYVLEIYTNGNPRLYWRTNGVEVNLVFTKVNVITGEELNLTIVRDIANKTAYCYVDGVLKETKTWTNDIVELRERPSAIGSDKRLENRQMFKGALKNVTLYSDVRTADEVKANNVDTTDTALLCHYDFTASGSKKLKDHSTFGNHLKVVNHSTSEGVDGFIEVDNTNMTGISFTQDIRYVTSNAVAALPKTFEIWLNVSKDAGDGRLGTIVGNYNGTTPGYQVEIRENGLLSLWWRPVYNKGARVDFDTSKVDLRTGEWTHLAVTVDIANNVANCYVNGVLVDTAAPVQDAHEKKLVEMDMSTNPYVYIGTNDLTQNERWLQNARIHSVALYDDMRTAEEIACDYADGISEAGSDLLGYYVLSTQGNGRLRDYSSYGNHLNYISKDKATVKESYVDLSNALNLGMTFGWNDYYIENSIPEKFPRTIEATVYYPDNYPDTNRGGIIYGNYNGILPCFDFEITTNGNPRLYIRNEAGKTYDLRFGNANVYNGKATNVTFVIEDDYVKLYIDGVLTQTTAETTAPGIGAFVDSIKMTREMLIGADWRERNEQYFRGQLIDLTLYSDARTADEVASDYKAYGSDGLVARYEFSPSGSYPETVKDLSGNGNDISHSKYFYDYDVPEDFAYSLLILGDTQYVNHRYPENFHKIYDWILANKDAHKVQYMLGLGDITDKSTASEWERAKEQFARLDGKLPYSLVIGNHDTTDTFNAAFDVAPYNTTFDGKYGDGVANTYRYVTIGRVDYLVMTLEFGPTDDVLDWANEVVADHPHHNVIVTTHGYMNSDGTTLDTNDKWAASGYNPETGGWVGYGNAPQFNDGDEIWEKFIRKHANISFVISGHIESNSVLVIDAVGDNGNVVKQMLVDPQGIDARHPGGTGMITILYFNEDGSQVDVRTYSTIYDGLHRAELSYTPEVHTVNPDHVGGKATCQKGAVCEICGEEYTEKDLTNHVSNEFIYTEIDGVTHKVAYKCCGAEAPDGDCVYGNDNICDYCGYDKTVEVETEDVKNAIDNILNGGTADVTVVGPTTTMDEAFVVEKIENTVGYQYALFNIDFDENGDLFLRHHFIVTGELPEVTVDSVAETLKQDEGYNTYYVDTYY